MNSASNWTALKPLAMRRRGALPILLGTRFPAPFGGSLRSSVATKPTATFSGPHCGLRLLCLLASGINFPSHAHFAASLCQDFLNLAHFECCYRRLEGIDTRSRPLETSRGVRCEHSLKGARFGAGGSGPRRSCSKSRSARTASRALKGPVKYSISPNIVRILFQRRSRILVQVLGSICET